MKKLIATHNKIFHADEVSAVALLELFTEDEYIVQRVDHNTTDFSKYDFVIDIGRKYDNQKYFDHHQYKGGKSSAGLIWDYIGLNKQYSKISKLIDLIDKNDVGIEKAKEFEYSSLIKCFNNSEDIYGYEQDVQFTKAVEFAKTVFISYKNLDEEQIKAKEIINRSYFFCDNKSVIELDEFTISWGKYINYQTMPQIKAVVWNDIYDNNWKIQLVSKSPDSFETNSKLLKQDSSMEFVHSAGHFAIAKDEITMKDYINKYIN
ncbi:MAG: MYG1 family protein [Arcobacteraceae bacterium]|jgi:uncharacterized UPF0160 family protein|nr:MYG1 family protein [Arcobacteraceae bacterium]